MTWRGPQHLQPGEEGPGSDLRVITCSDRSSNETETRRWTDHASVSANRLSGPS